MTALSSRIHRCSLRVGLLSLTVATALIVIPQLNGVSEAQPIPGRLDVLQNVGPGAPQVRPAAPERRAPAPPPPARAAFDTERVIEKIDALGRSIKNEIRAVKPDVGLPESERRRVKEPPAERIPSPEIQKLTGVIAELKGQVELLRQAVEKLNKSLVNTKNSPKQ